MCISNMMLQKQYEVKPKHNTYYKHYSVVVTASLDSVLIFLNLNNFDALNNTSHVANLRWGGPVSSNRRTRTHVSRVCI
jgi:hypothetical protein